MLVAKVESAVTSILLIVLFNLANTTDLERSRFGFEQWPLKLNSRITSDSGKKLETQFVSSQMYLIQV